MKNHVESNWRASKLYTPRTSSFSGKFFTFFEEMREKTKKLQNITEANHEMENYSDILKIP
jgi:hypothetical protein